MSLAINITTPEGIVLAADSRQSYRNKGGTSRIGSDSASKLFQINNRIGVAITGAAFIPENGVPKNVSKFIDQFKRKVGIEKLSVAEVAKEIFAIFDGKIKEYVSKIPDQLREDLKRQGCEILEIQQLPIGYRFKFKDSKGVLQEGQAGFEGVTLLVAGYNIDGSHEVYNVTAPGEIAKRRDSRERGLEYGASWIGQTDVVARIIKGWDVRVFNTPIVQEAIQKHGEQLVKAQLNGLEYAINWGAMPLQDAIDFSVLAIKTTEAIQKYSDGIQVAPGDIPGVGGPIDILVLTQDGPQWISRKELKVNVE